MVGLTAEGHCPINIDAKVMQLFVLCLKFSHVGEITSLLICSPMLKGIAAVVARWSGLGIRQFTRYYLMVRYAQGT